MGSSFTVSNLSLIREAHIWAILGISSLKKLLTSRKKSTDDSKYRLYSFVSRIIFHSRSIGFKFGE